jgi:hypothetical protein
MAKTIMDMTLQELLKMFVNDVGELIDARIRTAEITIKANTDAAIKASEQRTKEELSKKIIALDNRLGHKIQQVHEVVERQTDKQVDHEKRIEKIEDHLGLSQN